MGGLRVALLSFSFQPVRPWPTRPNPQMASAAAGFIIRSGTNLFDPSTNTTLRFVSFNTPTLSLQDDPSFVVPTPFEQDDLLSSIQQMGSRVVRMYALSVQMPSETATATKHIVKSATDGKIGLQEVVMRGLDSALALARQRNVKVIIPLIDRWEWWGGISSFVQLVDASLPTSAFFTNTAVISSFKSIIVQLLTRNNTVNGIPYRNDSTVMLWETGNELELDDGKTPAAWTRDIAAYIRSFDSQHLIMDGSFKHGWDAEVLADPNIDVFSNHFYRNFVPTTGEWALWAVLTAILIIAMVMLCMLVWSPRKIKVVREAKGTDVKRSTRLKQLLLAIVALGAMAGAGAGIAVQVLHRVENPRYGDSSASDAVTVASYNKAYIVGEFGFSAVASIQDVIGNVVRKQEALAGALVWSLRGHSSAGGMYTHKEAHDYQSYHFPGFPAAPGFGPDEQEVINAVKTGAQQIAAQTGFSIPAATLPVPPTLLNATSPALTWRGSAGASSYSVERADAAAATPTWTVVGSQVMDNVPQNKTLFTDSSSVRGVPYLYRVRANNALGTGNASNAVTITG
ncbi:glycoside hydrolase superfamily [Fimicolochytrium jonesii]|uniref:glycoside hydrolase superfamily n=1 Tax=Fimicolochytrium jonesii TaxID=1396493 RepID=UPI0022FF3541|nr:glycoside hydrolase superfamily [Fimicolochytrium jonesii]KAI8825769.1 glycoside hydrolase superfamily [Fimicolochytrium jonesii]